MRALPEIVNVLSGIELFKDLEKDEHRQLDGLVCTERLQAGALDRLMVPESMSVPQRAKR